MATIIARFPGQCRACKGGIEPGQRIEYTKGQPVRHADCTDLAQRPQKPQTFWCRGAVAQGPHAATGTPARTVQIERGPHAWQRGGRVERLCQDCQETERRLFAAYREVDQERTKREIALGAQMRAGKLTEAALDRAMQAIVTWDIEARQEVAQSFGIGGATVAPSKGTDVSPFPKAPARRR